MNLSPNQREPVHTCSPMISSLGWDKLECCKRQPNFCPIEMGAETTKAHSACLAQEKMQTLQKEAELKITLTDVKRCWGRNSMWYQVKKKNKQTTCFSQVQIRTTHWLLDCSKGTDQCSVRLWAALLSSAGSGGIWLIQEHPQFTLGYFRSCERPLYSQRARDNHFNRWHIQHRLWLCERSSRYLPWKKFWVKCPFHWLHCLRHFKCACQSVVIHPSQKLPHFPKHSTFKSHPCWSSSSCHWKGCR